MVIYQVTGNLPVGVQEVVFFAVVPRGEFNTLLFLARKLSDRGAVKFSRPLGRTVQPTGLA